MKKLLASTILFTSLTALNAEESSNNQSGFLLGVEAFFGYSISHNAPDLAGSSSIMGGIHTGYQYYFDENFGMRFLIAVHDGSPIIAKLEHNAEISALPFWLGSRFDVVWNYWESGDHTLGLSVGIEYDFETYHSREIKVNNKKQHNLASITQHNVYPIIGLYYYYKNNQISLDYRYSGASKPKSQTDILNVPSLNRKTFEAKYIFDESLALSWSYRF